MLGLFGRNGHAKHEPASADDSDLHCHVCGCRNYTLRQPSGSARDEYNTVFECGFELTEAGARVAFCDRPGQELRAREEAKLRHDEMQKAIGTAIKLKAKEDELRVAQDHAKALQTRIDALELQGKLSGKDSELALARAEADLLGARAELADKQAEIDDIRRELADARTRKPKRGGDSDDKLRDCLQELREYFKGNKSLGGSTFSGTGKAILIKMCNDALKED